MAYYNFSGVAMATTGWNPSLLTAIGTSDLIGTALGERLEDASAAGNRLIGGGGNDSYSIGSFYTTVIEGVNGGIDTVTAWQSFALPANVENLTVGRPGATGIGNSAGNLLIAWNDGIKLDGGAGDDVLADESTNGSTRFLFSQGSGRDVVYGFDATSAKHDIISLKDFGISNFAQVAPRLSQQGADVLLNLNGSDQVLLKSVKLADLDASDFAFQLDRSKLVQTFSDDFTSGISLYDLANGGGTWKTNGFNAAQTGSASYMSRTSNDEKQIYVDPAYAGSGSTPLGLNPFSVDNGVLTITASKTPDAAKGALYGKDWVSGEITTERSFAQLYGYFEIKAKLPGDKGIWPSFWMMPVAGGQPPEIDVLENIGTPEALQTIHSNDANASSISYASFLPDNATAFHTYGVLWNADNLIWYVDGVEVSRTATPSDMHQPMYMIATMAVGGGWAGDTDPKLTSSGYEIDYIKAYQLADTAGQAIAGAGAIFGTGNNDTISGGAGADTLDGMGGHDLLIGGAGNDTYIVYSAGDVVQEQANGGTDTVKSWASTTLSANVENLVLLGHADLDGTGNALDNVITGNWGRNHLYGGAGNDTLDATGGRTWAAGAQGDWLYGGTGNDTYITNDTSDVLVENANEGIDTVRTTYDYTLGANFENLVLLDGVARGTGNELANLITGNAGYNVLTGMGGDDTLDGGAGADFMTGGTGNDTYIVDNAGDMVIEKAGEGTDTILSSVSFTISPNVENLTLTGTGDISGTGNDLGNLIKGNAGANLLDGGWGNDTIYGGAGDDRIFGGAGADMLDGNTGNDRIDGGDGNDWLYGGDGNDTLIGGSGADTMAGNTGNDTYYVDDAGDRITEKAGEGTDLVMASVTHTLAANVENLTLTGTAAIDGTGNGDANLITGNGAANQLDGAAGNDTIYGGGGDDRILGGAGADVLDGNAGNDWIDGGADNDSLYGASGNDTLIGGAGNDYLRGDAGKDMLTGGTGADRFVFARASDSTVAIGGRDVIADFARAEGDKIDLTGLRVADPLKFVSDFTGHKGDVLVAGSGDTWIVSADLDGDKVADFAIEVHSATSLIATDFLL